MLVERYLDPKNDIAFKKIFGVEKNKDILIKFLNDIVKKDCSAKINDLKFLNPVLTPDIAWQKQSIVDVLCIDNEGTQFIVEMQVAKLRGFEKRAQYYAAKTYASQMNVGGSYENLKEVIFLAIVDHIIFQDKEGYKSDHIILDKKTYTHDLKDFSFTFIELPKFKKDKIEDLQNDEEKWCYFFKHCRYDEDMSKFLYDIRGKSIDGSNDAIIRAYNELASHHWSKEELNAYEAVKKSDMDAKARERYVREEAAMEAREKGRKEGREEGREEGKMENMNLVALRMVDNGHDIESISTITGLTIEQIKKLNKLS